MSTLGRGSIGASARAGARSARDAVARLATAASARADSSVSRSLPSPREMSAYSDEDRQQITTMTMPTPASMIRVRMDTRNTARWTSGRPQHIADPAHGVQQARLAGRLELVAQVADVHVDDVARGGGGQAPHRVEQLRAAQHLPGMSEEVVQQVELLRGEVDRASGPVRLAGGRVEDEVTEGEAARGGSPPAQ